MNLTTRTSPAGEIDALAGFLPRIETMSPHAFERTFATKLTNLDAAASPEERDDLRARCFDACGPELDHSPLHVRTRYKPLGYAGDYRLIDRIYQARPLMNGRGGLWDRHYLDTPGARGVRDRKRWFVEQFGALLERFGRPISVLNLASGPCRDVLEAVQAAGDAADGSFFFNVDTEPRAIEFARELTAPLDNVGFYWENKNALRVRPVRRFDFAWSAGLFDYLGDRVAVALIERMWNALRPGGRGVFGNAHLDNPTRLYIEWCLDWVLIHRDEEAMLELCRRAGVPEGCVSFDRERNGVFAFCIFDKPEARS